MSATAPKPSASIGKASPAQVSPGSRFSALSEAALVALLAWGLHAGLRALGVPIAVGALATVATLAACSWLLRRQGERWRDLGFCRPSAWRRMVLWSIGLFAADMLAPALLTIPLADAIGLPPQRLDAFASLQGNLGMYLVLLIGVAWGTAAFGEELIYRGFIFTRLTYALGGSKLALTAALILQAIVFALGHRYLGPRGMINAGLVGLLAGGAYIANGRALWPLIVAHAAVDTVGLTALYLGVGHG